VDRRGPGIAGPAWADLAPARFRYGEIAVTLSTPVPSSGGTMRRCI